MVYNRPVYIYVVQACSIQNYHNPLPHPCVVLGEAIPAYVSMKVYGQSYLLHGHRRIINTLAEMMRPAVVESVSNNFCHSSSTNRDSGNQEFPLSASQYLVSMLASLFITMESLATCAVLVLYMHRKCFSSFSYRFLGTF